MNFTHSPRRDSSSDSSDPYNPYVQFYRILEKPNKDSACVYQHSDNLKTGCY